MFITLTAWNNVRFVIDPTDIGSMCVNKEAEDSPTKTFLFAKGTDTAHHVRETLDEVLALIPAVIPDVTA